MSRRHRRRTHQRLLSMETLEGRRLLVVGTVDPEVPPQNYGNPEDSNNDGIVSPLDALIVVNALNQGQQSGSPKPFSTDVDGDGIVSPRDALLVINRLNSGSETSSVPPQQRAIGLRKSLDAGLIPPKMSLSDAQEMLETLENGGHYEAGDRYRNGQMLKTNEQPQDFGGASTGDESEDVTSAEQPVDWTTENLLPEVDPPQLVEENDPLAWFDSADETLFDPLSDPTLWPEFLDTTDPSGTWIEARLSIQIAEQLAERVAMEDAREQLAQVIADAVQNGDKTVEEIYDEVAALRATLGDASSQTAQLFANLDVKEIIEQIGVDLGTLAEAIVSSDHFDASQDDAYLAEILSREYLDATLP